MSKRDFHIFFEYTPSDNYQIYSHFKICISAGHFFGKNKRFSDKIYQKIRREGIQKVLNTKKKIFMDSGGFQLFSRENINITQKEIFEIQKDCKPTFAASLDVPTDLAEIVKGKTLSKKQKNFPEEELNNRVHKTIENANKFYDLWRKKDPDFDPVGVIQGYNKESYQFCARKLKEIDFPYYGIGSLSSRSKKETKRRVKWVRKIISEKPLHLFGVSDLPLVEKMIKKYKITSIDTATHIVAASFGNVIIDGVQKRGKKAKQKVGNLIKKGGNDRKYKLALFNAGQMKKYLFQEANPFSHFVKNHVDKTKEKTTLDNFDI